MIPKKSGSMQKNDEQLIFRQYGKQKGPYIEAPFIIDFCV